MIDTHDDQTFRDNIALSQDFAYFFAPLEEKQLGSGRPAAELVKWLGYVVWGNDLGWFHLLVVAIHTVAALVLARTALQLGLNLELSLIGGVLFLVNVTHVRAVQWISGLDYPLALVCGLGAVLCFARHLFTGKPAWLLGSYGCLMLGVMSHFSIVAVLPFCLYWSWYRGIGFNAALRKLLPISALVGVMLLFLLGITAKTSSTWHSIGLYAEGDFLGLVAGISRVLLWFLSRLLSTAHWYLVPVYVLQTWELYVGCAVLAVLLVLVWKRSSPGAICAVWILMFLAPFLLVTEATVLGLLTGPSRYLYSATVGSSLLLAWGIQWVSHRISSGGRLVGGGILAAVLVSSYISLKQAEAFSHYTSGRAYAYNQDFDTAEQQFRLAIDKGPGVIDLEETYARLCMILMDRIDKAEPVVQEAIEAFPDSPKPKLALYRQAIDLFDASPEVRSAAAVKIEALKGDSNAELHYLMGKTFHNLGLGFESGSDFEQAIQAFRLALEFDARRTASLKRLGTIFVNTGRPHEAVPAALRAVEIDPNDTRALHLAAYAQLKAGKIDEAIVFCKRALRIDSDADLFALLADCYAKKGAYIRATDVYRRALAEDAGHVVVRTKLGLVLYFQGRLEEAIEEYTRVLDTQPNSLAQFNLGLSYLAQGRVIEAKQVYATGIEQFGATEGARVGAIGDLKNLVAKGVQATAAQEILGRYWPEPP